MVRFRRTSLTRQCPVSSSIRGLFSLSGSPLGLMSVASNTKRSSERSSSCGIVFILSLVLGFFVIGENESVEIESQIQSQCEVVIHLVCTQVPRSWRSL